MTFEPIPLSPDAINIWINLGGPLLYEQVQDILAPFVHTDFNCAGLCTVTFRIWGELNTQRMEAKNKKRGPIMCLVGVVSRLSRVVVTLRFFPLSLIFSPEKKKKKKNSPDKLRRKMTGFPLWFVSLTSASPLILLLGRLSTPPPQTHGRTCPVGHIFPLFLLPKNRTQRSDVP